MYASTVESYHSTVYRTQCKKSLSSVLLRASQELYTCTCTYACICTCVRMQIHVHVRVCMYMYMCTYAYVHVHVHVCLLVVGKQVQFQVSLW